MRGRPARLRTLPLLGENLCFVLAWVIRSSGAMCRVWCVFCHAHLSIRDQNTQLSKQVLKNMVG
jgi:hypothetical protein